MNLISDSDNDLCYVNFIEDKRLLSVGTIERFKVFSLQSLQELELIHQHLTEKVYATEWPVSSSLVTWVCFESQQKFHIFNYEKGEIAVTFVTLSPIISVKLTKDRIIVCQTDRIDIYDIPTMKLIKSVEDVAQNHDERLIALPSNMENSYMAYPTPYFGEVSIFDTINLLNTTKFKAHNGILEILSFNSDGTKLATASAKGTVIRVFNIPDGSKYTEFRRGLLSSATIYSLSFSPDSTYLCASSNRETVHIFKLEDLDQQNLSLAEDYTLPKLLSNVLCLNRAFATARLPFSDIKTISSLVVIENELHVLIASANGWLYVYHLNTNEGGECNLLVRHRFHKAPENLISNSQVQNM